MSMTPRERILAVYDGEEPDKIPVCTYEAFIRESPNWAKKLQKRGLGVFRHAAISKPSSWLPIFWQPSSSRMDARYTINNYSEKGIRKYRLTWETPIGSITGVLASNPKDYSELVTSPTPAEYPVKNPSDWRVINYFIKDMLDNLEPSYQEFEEAEKDIGDNGVTVAFNHLTAWQNAWIFLAGPERAVIDFHEQSNEVQEFIELVKLWNSRMAEIAAGSPAKFIDIAENITDMTSPTYYRKYCLPIYEIYSKQLKGTDKILGAHMDGRLGKLKKEIAESPLDVIESFSLPPTGDISPAEAKKIWPGKMLFMNTAPHMAWAKPEEVKKYYEDVAREWGSKKGLLLEFSELLPPETVEAHLSAAMDAFGY
ncbi:MAG: hypothetical protein KAV87_02135 [Desulfobacteraceae bacterium]|nr:hypothetical protein [Desulfobacteraceae bacterium]